MKKIIKYTFMLLVISAVVFLVYQSQRATLRAEIAGLTLFEQTLFTSKGRANFWSYQLKQRQTDDVLKKFKASTLKRRLKVKVKGDRLILSLRASDLEKPRYSKLLNRIALLAQQYLNDQSQQELLRLQGVSGQLRDRYRLAQTRRANYVKANQQHTAATLEAKRKSIHIVIADAKEKIKKLKRQNEVLQVLEEEEQFSLRYTKVDLPSAGKYRQLEQQYEELTIRYKAKHPKMISIKAELAALKGIILSSFSRQTQILNSRIKMQWSSLRRLKKEKNKSASIRRKIGALTAGMKQKKAVYEKAMTQKAEILNRRPSTIVAARLIGGAGASAPEALRYFGGVFLLILMGTALFVIFNRKIYQPGHIAKQKVPLLAVMPKLKKDQRVPLHSHILPNSFYSKNLTIVRNRLLSQFNKKPAVLLVSSASNIKQPVSLVSNLCISLAQSQKRVLLIDCHLKSPSQSKLFRLENKGLSEVLHNNYPFEKAIQKVEVPNLTVLPAGSGLTLKALCSDGFESILGTCRSQYDFVILDSPSFSSGTDSILISQHTDGVIVTIPTGKVTRQTLKWVKSELKRANVPMIGVILKEVSNDMVTEWNKTAISEPQTNV